MKPNRHPQRYLYGAISLGVLALLLLLPGSRTLPLLDRDEPRFSRATIEMIERGDWVVPWFNGQYRFDKPVLTYWLMRAGYAVFGRNELGARAHAVFTAALMAALLYRMGLRWWSEGAGMAAGLTWLFALQVFIHGRAAVADMPMVLAVTAAHEALWHLLAGEGAGPRRGWWWQLWLSLSVGFLAKGPVAILVPLVTLLLWRWGLERRPLRWRNLGALRGALLALAVIAPWGLLALLRTGGEFWRIGIGHHVVRRGLEAFDGRPFIPFYYLPTALFSYFPWVAWVGAAVVAARRDRTPLTRFLLSWWLSPYLIFFAYTTQLPHYILPGMPAFFLLLGRAADPRAGMIARGAADLPRWARRWRTGVIALGGTLIVLATAAAALARGDPLLGPLAPLLVGFALLLLGLLTAQWLYPRPSSPVMVAAVLLLAVGGGVFARTLRELSAGPALQAMLGRLPAGTECIWHRYQEPSTVFYTGCRWRAASGVEEIRDRMRTPGPRVVLSAAERLDVDDLLRTRLAERGWGRPKRARSDWSAELERLALPGYRRRDLRVFVIGTGSWYTLSVFDNLETAGGGPSPASP
ncbi:MAG: glycosyltransferase family 39 protein [Kiritimatiellae bacterium]|nr:glycosyltransferase family 39 protein [Kiritimatiellia bacterium]